MVARVAAVPDFHIGNVTNILFCHTSSPSGKLFSGLKEPLSMASRRLKHKYFQRMGLTEIKVPHFRNPSSEIISCHIHTGQSGDQIPVGARFSLPVQTGPGAH